MSDQPLGAPESTPTPLPPPFQPPASHEPALTTHLPVTGAPRSSPAGHAPSVPLETGSSPAPRRGPAIGTILFGLFLLVFASAVGYAQVADRVFLTADSAPFIVIGAGGVVLLLGLLGTVARRKG